MSSAPWQILKKRVTVEIRAESTFEFFLRPQLVVDISDPAVGLKLVDTPEVLSHGDVYQVEFIAFGGVRKVTYKASIDRDSLSMVETMLEGDLQAWEHTKTFHTDADRTVITDSIAFEPPSGLAGFLMTADKIADNVADGIAYRNERLSAALKEFASSER